MRYHLVCDNVEFDGIAANMADDDRKKQIIDAEDTGTTLSSQIPPERTFPSNGPVELVPYNCIRCMHKYKERFRDKIMAVHHDLRNAAAKYPTETGYRVVTESDHDELVHPWFLFSNERGGSIENLNDVRKDMYDFLCYHEMIPFTRIHDMSQHLTEFMEETFVESDEVTVVSDIGQFNANYTLLSREYLKYCYMAYVYFIVFLDHMERDLKTIIRMGHMDFDIDYVNAMQQGGWVPTARSMLKMLFARRSDGKSNYEHLLPRAAPYMFIECFHPILQALASHFAVTNTLFRNECPILPHINISREEQVLWIRNQTFKDSLDRFGGGNRVLGVRHIVIEILSSLIFKHQIPISDNVEECLLIQAYTRLVCAKWERSYKLTKDRVSEQEFFASLSYFTEDTISMTIDSDGVALPEGDLDSVYIRKIWDVLYNSTQIREPTDLSMSRCLHRMHKKRTELMISPDETYKTRKELQMKMRASLKEIVTKAHYEHEVFKPYMQNVIMMLVKGVEMNSGWFLSHWCHEDIVRGLFGAVEFDIPLIPIELLKQFGIPVNNDDDDDDDDKPRIRSPFKNKIPIPGSDEEFVEWRGLEYVAFNFKVMKKEYTLLQWNMIMRFNFPEAVNYLLGFNNNLFDGQGKRRLYETPQSNIKQVPTVKELFELYYNLLERTYKNEIQKWMRDLKKTRTDWFNIEDRQKQYMFFYNSIQDWRDEGKELDKLIFGCRFTTNHLSKVLNIADNADTVIHEYLLSNIEFPEYEFVYDTSIRRPSSIGPGFQRVPLKGKSLNPDQKTNTRR